MIPRFSIGHHAIPSQRDKEASLTVIWDRISPRGFILMASEISRDISRVEV